MKYPAAQEQALVQRILAPELALDPERFVRFMYPWQQPNTPLASHGGPRNWQMAILQEVAFHLRNQNQRMALDLLPQMFRRCTVSGRGIGKSALVGWLNHWMMSTTLGATCMVSANSEPQLKGTTFPEIKKWFALGLNSHWYDPQALSIIPAEWFARLIRDQLKIDTGYYYVQAKLWTEENPDSYAGPHSTYGVMLTFDEASGIHEGIWKVSQGFFTEPTLKRFHLAYSNGRRNSGAFYDNCQPGSGWRTGSIDARSVEGTDQEVYTEIIRKYGADSDEARVEVYGMFPSAGEQQFVPTSIVQDAQGRELPQDSGAALVLGVDPARKGRDATVLRWRQGRDARSIPPVKLYGLDNMQAADAVARWIDRTKPDAVCIDAGNGTGIIDRLRQLKYRVHEVWFGSKSSDPRWYNKRTQMYADMREWLVGGCIDDDRMLRDDLTKLEYKRIGKGHDVIALEEKEDLKARLGRSPDDGDALALTFAVNVARRDLRASRSGRRATQAADVDYRIGA